MRLIARLVLVLFATVMVALTASTDNSRGELIAFSLKQAAEKARLSPINLEVQRIAGITEFIGFACDRSAGDLILVGRRQPRSQAISVDDLAVALRAILLHKTWPLVSIDRTSSTKSEDEQIVRFAGGIEGTAFGRDLLNADILLKRLALGELDASVWGVRSYYDLFRDWWTENHSQEQVHSRFWFTTGSSFVAYREGGALLKAVDVQIETRITAASKDGIEIKDLSGIRDLPGEAFSAALTSRFEDIGNYYPEIKRVRALFQLVGLASAIQKLPAEYSNIHAISDYWTRDYGIAPETTAAVYPLHRKSSSVSEPSGRIWDLSLDGGIELKALTLEIKDGSVTAFKDMVLRSRPDEKALSWILPVSDYCLPNTSMENTGEDACSATQDIKTAAGSLSCSISRVAHPSNTAAPPLLITRGTGSELLPSSMPSIQFSSSLNPSRFSSRVGGVMLSGAAKVGGGSEKIDLADGKFSLIVNGENSRPDPQVFRKFVTALWSVYFGRQDPGISIDPISMDPETGGFSEKHLVRYIGRVVNTDLGRVMREADYQMKKWSVGTGKADVPGFKSPDQIAGRSGTRYLSLSRFWLVPEDMKFRSADNMLLYDGGRMTVKTEILGSDESGRKQADPHNERFAEFFTQHYEEIAKKHTVYQELFDYAKLVALAKYLKESGIPLFWFLMANKDLVLTEDSPGTVDNLVKGSDYWRGLTIQGGVDLATKGNYVFDAAAVKAINEAAEKAASRPERATSLSGSSAQQAPLPFSFGLGAEKYSVAPQHSQSAGRDRHGILYQTDLALRAEGYLVTADLLNTIRSEMIRQNARRILAPEIEKLSESEISSKADSLVSAALEQSARQVEPLLKKLEPLKNQEFKNEAECARAWDQAMGNDAAEWRPFFVKQAHYSSDLQLVRYFNPRLPESSEFGMGWRLLIPYQVKPADKTTISFQNVMVPKQMEIENLITGTKEVLTFSTDRYAAAGYVPDKIESSQFVGLFLLSNASFRLVDKIGSEFQFDQAGFLTDLMFSDDHRMHIDYANESSDAFSKKPYSLEPADSERIAFLNAQIPKSMKLTDLIHNQTEVLTFSKDGRIAGYVPADTAKSRYKILALMSDASFQLVDTWGNEVNFSPSGEFERMAIEPRTPKSISMGNHKIDFGYTIDQTGRALIASASLSKDVAGALPTHFVQYEYDSEGRLARAERGKIQAAEGQPLRERGRVMTAASSGQ